MGYVYRVIFAQIPDSLCLGYMPEEKSEESDASENPDVTFVLQGFSSLSHMTAGSSSTTPSKRLDKDLQKYESRANDYCTRILKEAAVGVPVGSKPVLDPPDPLAFWTIQVCYHK